jgi:hypothetical protein
VFLIIFIWAAIPVISYAQSNLDENWETRPYNEEVKIYWKIVSELKKKSHRFWSSYNQSKNSLDALWAEWSAGKKQKAEKWFKASSHYPSKLAVNLEYLESEYPKDKAHWDGLTANNRMLIRGLWKSYIKFLRNENDLFKLRVTYYNNKLYAMKVYGESWFEDFAKECIEDYYYVLKDVISKISDELINCFKGALTTTLKNIFIFTITEDPDSLGNIESVKGGVISCIKGIPLKSIINALEAAVKRQFIKEMKEKEIEELVAAYWWDKVVMGRKKEPILAEAIDTLMTAEFWTKELTADKVKKWAADTAVPEIKRQTKKLYQQEYRRQILDKGLKGTPAAKEFRKKYKKFIDKVALEKTEDHVYNQYLEALSFVQEYLAMVDTVLISGRGKFDNIAEKLYAKYRHVKKCLIARKEKVTGQKMLAIFKKSEKDFNKWFKENCNGEDDALKKALGEAKKTLDRMKKAVTDSRQDISDADGLCGSIKDQLALAEQVLPDKETKEKSPLDQYAGLKTEIEKKIEKLESIRKVTNDDYISAGLYKRNCEKKTLKACEKALLLKRIRDSKMPPWKPGISDPDLNKNPGGVMSGVSAAAAQAKNHGNQSLSDIKKIEDNSETARDLYDSIKDSVDSYVQDIRDAKETENDKYTESREYLEKARTTLGQLYAKTIRIGKTESMLKNGYMNTDRLFFPYKSNKKAKSILDEMEKIYKAFTKTARPATECYENMKSRVDKFRETHYSDKTNYDSRENRENLEKLQRLAKRAWGLLVGISEDAKQAKKFESAVETAMNNAKKCEDKAKEFLERIREIQKEKGESDSGYSDEDDTDDSGLCRALKRAFYNCLPISPGTYDFDNFKSAEEVLNTVKEKGCPFYEEGLRELDRYRKCVKIMRKFYAALANNKSLAKSIAKQNPECFDGKSSEDEDDSSGFSTSGGDTISDDSSGFSTSGGDTVSEDSSSTNGTDKDNCINLENDFYAALNTGDISWAQSIINKAQDCPFYSRGTDMLQSAIEAQEDENKREEENRCRKLYRELVNATKSNDLSLVRSIMAKSRNCSFYDQGVKWVENAERNRYCQNLLRNFYNAIRIGQPAAAQRILENGRKTGCSFPPEANQLLQQAYNLSRQRDIERRRIKNQQMNNLLNSFSNIIRNMSTSGNVPTYRPPAYTTPSSGSGSGGGVKGRPPTRTQPDRQKRSYEYCLNKYCPECKKAISFLNESASKACERCKVRNKKKIEDCMKGL